MKKDSFTFSDKLKKSKTLPLSKRLPSRVGGEVKAKRTLFERAQRDLPFIIVAALALLLLPFLSREAGDIDTASVVWPEGGEEYITDINGAGTGEDEIALSSYRNPLDLIIRHGEQDGSAKDAIDTYGAGSEESSEYGSSSSSSYGSEDYSSSPATSRYGKTAKRTVRNSITRTPTSIGSFRPGSMVSPGANSGIGHTMAFGSRAKDGAPKVQGPGVRPVALQPLTAAGKGRDLTGADNLYAEAARSIGAMNTPGAKQALLDAQLKDVDGKPLGDTKAAGAAQPGKGPGAAGNLSNNWNHSPLKPWWWDMMKQRSQMRWELWHYNWEKMASDSLIKLTAGLASCLLTGSNDFAVGKFLGKPGGAPDYECWVNGSAVSALGSRSDYASGFEHTTKDKEGATETKIPFEIAERYEKICTERYHGTVVQTSSNRQNFIDVRLRCLGLKLSELKNKFENKRSGVCHLDEDPMSVDIIVKRNGKHRPNQVNKMGYYIVSEKQLNSSVDGAKCKENKDDKGNPNGTYSCQCVTYIKKAEYGRNVLPKIDEEKDGKLKDVVIYKVGSYTLLDDDYYKTDDIVVDDKTYHETFAVAKALTESPNNQCLTETRLQEIMKPLGQWRTSEYHNTRLNQIMRCPASSFRHTEYEPVNFAPKMSTTQKMYDNTYMEDCRSHEVFIDKVPEDHRFSTTIKNPGKRTIAFVLEHVQGAAYSTSSQGSVPYVKDAKTVSDSTGWIIREKIIYDKAAQMNTAWIQDNSDGSVTFIGEAVVGLASNQTSDINEDKSGSSAERARALPGHGLIIWITTNETKDTGLPAGGFVAEPNPSLIFPHSGKVATCRYRWGCGQGDLCKAYEDSSLRVCFELDDNGNKTYYKAFSSGGFMLIESPKTEVRVEDLEGDIRNIKQCDPICKLKDGSGYQFLNSPSAQFVPPADLKKAYIDPNCPVCNSEPRMAPATGLVCVDPEKQREPCPCIKVDNPITPAQTPIPGTLYVRSDFTPVNPQEIELPVTPICYKKAIALGNIYVRNIPDGTAGERVNPDEDIVNMLLSKPKDVQDKLCPLCNPSLVCVDPKNGNEPCPCIQVDDPISPAGVNPLYVKSDITPVSPQEVKLPVTPICYLKAIALGNIYVQNPDGSAGEKVNPDQDIVNMLLSKPKSVQDKLCPYCGPTQQEVIEAKKKCEFIFRDTFDHNVFLNSRGTQDVNMAVEYITECIRMTDIAEINVIGHADKSDQSPIKDQKACPVGDESCSSTRNNISLSEDRALFITNEVLRRVQNNFTGQVKFEVNFIKNPNAASKTYGVPRYSNYKPSYGSGDRIVTFNVSGRGDADAIKTPIYDSNNKATNKEEMAVDRFVEILPFSYSSDN